MKINLLRYYSNRSNFLQADEDLLLRNLQHKYANAFVRRKADKNFSANGRKTGEFKVVWMFRIAWEKEKSCFVASHKKEFLLSIYVFRSLVWQNSHNM